MHFDINKTIIASDTAKDQDTTKTIFKLVADYIWGYVKSKQESANPEYKEFICVSKTLTLNKPDDDDIENKDSLTTFAS